MFKIEQFKNRHIGLSDTDKKSCSNRWVFNL